MKIQIIRNTVADGDVVRAGQIISVTVETGKQLIQLGKAVEYKEKEPLKNNSAALENSEAPQLVKRTAKKPGRPKKND